MLTTTNSGRKTPPSKADRSMATWAPLDPVALSLFLSQASTRFDLDGYAAVMWLNAGHLPASLPVTPHP